MNNYTFEDFIKDYKYDTILVADTALSMHGLVSGYAYTAVYTPHALIDRVHVSGGVLLQHYHFNDDYELVKQDNGAYLPSAERCLIDCMVWQDENRDEGFLIEALQTYQQMGHKVEDLYECADHYLVPHEVVDYWWHEAEEDTEMSMG